jgi:hypothetical protein
MNATAIGVSNMTQYTGTKNIKAVLTTRAQYCDYRGWTLPEDEDPNEEIYLVEYEADPSSKPNHPNHEGYISMSPKHVFEKAYQRSGSYLDRLIIERNELAVKISKLSTALINESVPAEQSDILTAQLTVMNSYLTILNYRLNK